MTMTPTFPAQVETTDQRPSTEHADDAVLAAFVGMVQALSNMLQAKAA